MMVANGGPRPPAGTLTQLFFEAIDRYDKPDALQVKLGGRYEPIGKDFEGSSVQVPAGASDVPGLAEALPKETVKKPEAGGDK